MAKLNKVRLSENPETKVIANAQGVDGKINVSSGGKPFVQLEIEQKGFGVTKKDLRTYWGNEDGTFNGFSPLDMQMQFEGKSLDEFGKFTTKTVAPYTIKGNDGVIRTVGTKTLFVFMHEKENSVFTSRGYSVTELDEATGEVSIIAEPKVRAIAPAVIAPQANNAPDADDSDDDDEDDAEELARLAAAKAAKKAAKLAKA